MQTRLTVACNETGSFVPVDPYQNGVRRRVLQIILKVDDGVRLTPKG